MKAILLWGMKVGLWTYLILACGVILTPQAERLLGIGLPTVLTNIKLDWPFLSDKVATPQGFFIFIVTPLIVFTLWEIYEWDRILARSRYG